MFEQELRGYIGRQVQIATSTDVIAGTLISVTNAAATVRTSGYPGYGGAEDVVVRLDTIAYVRIML